MCQLPFSIHIKYKIEKTAGSDLSVTFTLISLLEIVEAQRITSLGEPKILIRGLFTTA